MKNLWEDVKKWLGQTSQTVAKEAELLSRKGKIKLELFDISRRLEKAFADLGGMTYHLGFVKKKRSFLRDKKIKDVISLIKKLEMLRLKKQKELKSVDGAMGKSSKK